MAIPSKDKNILLLPVTDGGVTQPFNMPNFEGYDKTKANHNGLDLGYYDTPYCNILACQEGTVVDVYNNNSSFGNGIVLQHDYEDGTHRWTGYVHLKNAPKLKKGDKVKQGDAIGIRGGSPYVNGKAKYGIHLHLYCTKAVKVAYTWNTMKKYVIDPYPLLYKSKSVTYKTLATKAKYGMTTLKYIEDVVPEIVSPTERDPLKNQLLEKSSVLRVRTSPSIKGNVLGYLKANAYYDWYEIVSADGYKWYRIAPEQWVAQTGTMVVYPKQTEVDLLKEQVASLQAEVDRLKTALSASETLANDCVEKLNAIKNIIAD